MRKKRLGRLFNREFGSKPDVEYAAGDMASIRSYYEYRAAHQVDPFYIDDMTWNDVDGDKVYKEINPSLSSAGEQYLYYLLRQPAQSKSEHERRKQMIEYMEQHPEERLALQLLLHKIGRSRKIDLSSIFSPSPRSKIWLWLYICLAAMIPISLLIGALVSQMGFILFLIFAAINGIVHEVSRRKHEWDYNTVNYSVSMVFALQAIRRKKYDELDGQLEGAYAHLEHMRSILHVGGISTASNNDIVSIVMTLLLLDLITYEYIKRRILHCHDDIFAIHEALGQLDASIAIASWRKSLPVKCDPAIAFEKATPFIHANGMVHPLLHKAVPNDIDIKRPMLITGSNASGKSTYLKTTALSALLAQSLCTVTASGYHATAFRLFTSMALSDHILAGESYYIAETKSLKRILDQANGSIPILCMVDEVLRGTNTVERIAASTELLTEMSKKRMLCLAATHDIELCDLLAPIYDLAHFESHIKNNEVLFDYLLHPGKATTHNAIDLLRLIGFSDDIVKAAHRRAENYARIGKWV